jgi:hypothetical protein
MQKLHNRDATGAQSQCKRCAIAMKTLHNRDRCTTVALSLRYRGTITSHKSLRNRCAIDAQSTQNHYAITSQMIDVKVPHTFIADTRYVIAAQLPRNRCATK